MTKILLFVIFSLISNIVYANNTWPMKIAEVGCKFEFKDDFGDYIYKLEITETLQFPEIRVKRTDPGHLLFQKKYITDEKEKTKGLVTDLFPWFGKDKGLINLFPLSVGKLVKQKELVVQNKTGTESVFAEHIAEVLKFRKSPYIENSNEYLIQLSRSDIFIDNPSYIVIYRMWWNVELGFYTEDETPRNKDIKKFISTNCYPVL